VVPLGSSKGARVIDEDVSHDTSPQRKQVVVPDPFLAVRASNPNVSLVDESSWGPEITEAIVADIVPGNSLKVFVDTGDRFGFCDPLRIAMLKPPF
jgi:hypothetical protein